jgi:hypothetical protein
MTSWWADAAGDEIYVPSFTDADNAGGATYGHRAAAPYQL